MKPFALFLLVAAAWSAAACKSTTSPTVNVPFSQTDLRVGTGAEAVAGRRLTVNYTGWLYDASKTDNKGAQFDTSIGKTPYQFNVGRGEVIRGWDQGVPGMKVGGARRLIIPPDLGYGSTPNGAIPANSTLVFDIDLLAVQ